MSFLLWTGTGQRLKINHDTAGFEGQYGHASTAITWSVSNDAGYFFGTVDSSEINVTHVSTVDVRNGVFRS